MQTYACFSFSSYGVAIMDAVLNNPKRLVMPAGHHSDADFDDWDFILLIPIVLRLYYHNECYAYGLPPFRDTIA